MIRAIFLLAMVALTQNSFASELDNERSVTNRGIDGTVVIRTDKRTGQISYAETKSVLTTSNQVASLNANAFKAAPANNVKSELDRDAGVSSWYYFYNPWNANYAWNNCLYWGGNYYQPYQQFSYGYYSYSYYNYYSLYNRWW